MKTLLRSIVLTAFTVPTGQLIGCFSSETPVERSSQGRVQVKVSPIELEKLETEPDQLARVLSMPFVELAARLPPFAFECEAEMSFTQEARNFRQLDQHRYVEDDKQNFHAHVKSSETKEVNVWLKDGEFMVRQGYGKVRRTPRRDIEIEKWGELALSPQAHSFELFYPYLSVQSKGDEEFEGRSVRRYTLTLRESPLPTKDVYQLPRAETRLAPVAGWRQRAKPRDVSGFVLVDIERKVVLQASFRGSLELPSSVEGEAPSALTVRLDSTIRENSEEISTEELSHLIDEVSRARPKKGSLGFYDPPSDASP